MNTIDSIFSIVIIGITFIAMFYLVKQKKLTIFQAGVLSSSCWLMIATIVWLATILQKYDLDDKSKNVWDIASMVFTFLGTILTAGTAIAGITALLSYISINDKLKKAEEGLNLAQKKVTKFEELYKKTEQDLNSAQEKVTEFKELYEKTEQDLNSAQKTLTEFQGLYEKTEQDLNSAQEKLTEFNKLFQIVKDKKDELEKLSYETESYKIAKIQIQDLDYAKITNTETNQSAESAAEQILKSDYSQFEHRLKARAILDEIKLRKQFDEIIHNPSADAWQHHIIARGEIMALWQLVYQTSNTSNRKINRENYAITVSNYGTAYYFAALFHQYNEDKTVYFDLLHQASKQFDLTLQINPNLYQAANNWGNTLDREAQVLPNTKLVEKRRLWQLAGEKYALALQIQPNDNLAAINWGIVLGREANALSNTELTEKRRLWQLAGEKFALALDIKADFHHEAATNWGNVLNNEANALSNTELTEKRRLWQKAGEKYALALQIQPDYDLAANNWRIALNNEANALSDTEWEEKFNLWRNALNKVQTLQNLSEKHQQSSVLQNLVNQIEQQIADLEKRKLLW